MPKAPGYDTTERIEEVECTHGIFFLPPAGGNHPREVECNFIGDVEVQLGDGLKTWICPNCGADYEEGWSPEDDIDPDAGRD